MKDDLQFACLTGLAAILTASEVILAVTNSGPTSLHDVLLVVIGGLVGVAAPKLK